MPVPGKTTSHQSCRLLRALFKTEPQLAVGGGGPNPRNDNEPSTKIAEAIPNVIGTKTGANALGKNMSKHDSQ